MRVVSYEILIRAPAHTVYHHLTDPAALLTWIAASAESDPVVGGPIRWTLPNQATMRGRYVELRPPHRLVFSYGWEDDLMGVPPESTLVEIDLRTHPDGTLLTLTHRLLPDPAAEQHRHGWDYFLHRLATRLAYLPPTSDTSSAGASGGSGGSRCGGKTYRL
jgi:uncharacterized protein YndB with AHSA1/START domain